MYIKDLTKQNINDWFVEKLLRTEPIIGAIYWCKCKCGLEKEIRGSYLRSNKSKRCKKCSDKLQSVTKSAGELPDRIWNKIVSNAGTREIEFNLSKEFAYDLFLEQDKKCALTGIDIKFSDRGRKFLDTTASLDRIDSSKPYTKDNVWWVHKDVNMMKQRFSVEYFLILCQKVVNYVESTRISSEEYVI